MAGGAFRVKGYREFVRACDRSGPKSKRLVRSKLRELAEVVAVDWRSRLAPIDAGSAAGLRPVVRTRGVSVEQRRGRTTGQHPEFGALQMRRGVKALDANRSKIEGGFDRVMDEIADTF